MKNDIAVMLVAALAIVLLIVVVVVAIVGLSGLVGNAPDDGVAPTAIPTPTSFPYPEMIVREWCLRNIYGNCSTVTVFVMVDCDSNVVLFQSESHGLAVLPLGETNYTCPQSTQ